MLSITQSPQLRNFRVKILARMILASRDNDHIRQHLDARGWTIPAVRRELIARECVVEPPRSSRDEDGARDRRVDAYARIDFYRPRGRRRRGARS